MLDFCFRVHVEGRDIIILPNQYIEQNTPSTITDHTHTEISKIKSPYYEKLANKDLPDMNNNDEGKISHGDGQENLKADKDDDRESDEIDEEDDDDENEGEDDDDENGGEDDSDEKNDEDDDDEQGGEDKYNGDNEDEEGDEGSWFDKFNDNGELKEPSEPGESAGQQSYNRPQDGGAVDRACRASPGPLNNCHNDSHLSHKRHPGVIGDGRPRSNASRHQDRDRWGPYGGPFHFENEAVNIRDTGGVGVVNGPLVQDVAHEGVAGTLDGAVGGMPRFLMEDDDIDEDIVPDIFGARKPPIPAALPIPHFVLGIPIYRWSEDDSEDSQFYGSESVSENVQILMIYG